MTVRVAVPPQSDSYPLRDYPGASAPPQTELRRSPPARALSPAPRVGLCGT